MRQLVLRTFGGAISSILALFASPLWAGITAFVVYALFAARRGSILAVSNSPYFNYLADAFLHGQLFLRLGSPNLHDLALFQGHYFLYWPPFPAFVLMPLVALFGVGVSDVFITLCIGALNVALVALLLRRVDREGLIPLDESARGLLTIFFAFGTVHLLLAPLGNVWFTSQVIAFTCSILAFLAAIKMKGYPAFFFTGLALACATLTRNQEVFLGIWLVYFLLQRNKISTLRTALPRLFAMAAPVAAAVLIILLYNYFRFGSIFQYGLTYQDFGPFFQPDFNKYGHFNIHYLWTNFFYNFIYYPFPTSSKTMMGGSLFLLSPLFFAAFWSFRQAGTRKSVLITWGSILAVLIPILLNIGTGWQTFGPRYMLDFMVPLLLLTALGLRYFPRWLAYLLVLASIAQYYYGVIYFIRIT